MFWEGACSIFFSYRSLDFFEMLRHFQKWLWSDFFGPRFEFFQEAEEGGFPCIQIYTYTYIYELIIYRLYNTYSIQLDTLIQFDDSIQFEDTVQFDHSIKTDDAVQPRSRALWARHRELLHALGWGVEMKRRAELDWVVELNLIVELIRVVKT